MTPVEGQLPNNLGEKIRNSMEEAYGSASPRYFEFDSRRWPRNRYEAILRVTVPSERLLDVGCGDGLLLYNLASRANELFGLELAINRAEAADQALRDASVDATIVSGNIEASVDFPDNHFDTIVCADTLQYSIDVSGALAEMARMLRPGGQLVVTVPNIASLRRRVRLLLGQFPSTSAGNQGFDVPPGVLYDTGTLHYFTFETLTRLYEQSGIRATKRMGFGRLGRVRNVWPSLLSDGICLVGVKARTS